MKLKCPHCDYEGEFKKGKPPFWVFSLLDAHRDQKRAARTFACPQCKVEIFFPPSINLAQRLDLKGSGKS